MEKLKLQKLSGGLYLSGGADLTPPGMMRRYRGVSPISVNSLRSRDGSNTLHDLSGAPHSAIYYNSKWYTGASTAFYEETSSIRSGLSGDRLSFSLMPSTAGLVDSLFVAGGGDLFKVDSSGDVWDWGIEAPANTAIVVDGGAGGELTDGAVYKYRFTYYNSITGTRSNPTPFPSDLATNTILMLHFNGADGSTTITDQSPSANVVTAVGNAQVDVGDYRFPNGSCIFDGSGDYLSIPDSSDFFCDTDNMTIDCWIRSPSALTINTKYTIYRQYDDATHYVHLYYYRYNAGITIDRIYFEIVNGASTLTMYCDARPTYAAWQHIALIRGFNGTANSWHLTTHQVSGSRYGYETKSSSISWPDLAAIVTIGGDVDGNDFVGWIDEFRMLNGSAGWTGGFEPDTEPYGSNVEVDLAGGSTSIDLTYLPGSADSQVDYLELWRTIGGGDAYFYLTSLENGTTSYTDDISDDNLLSLELPVDNVQPYPWFDDCFGPWNASMFWITRSQEGERGRVYYSPVGRAEAVQCFIEVTSDTDGLQKIVSYAGNLYVVSKSRAFQIYGTNPYYVRELPGVAGTTAPHTVVVTPYGVAWESQDGPRIFSGGAQSKLLYYDQIKPLFRGVGVENLSSFTGAIATFARGEYIISDTSQTLALDLEAGRWRDLGLACTCLAYDPENDVIAAGIGTDLLEIENEGDTDDAGTDITFDIKTGEIAFDPPALVELIRIDADANGETLTFTPGMDVGTSFSDTLETTAGRRWNEFNLDARLTNRLSVRINGSIGSIVNIY